jgi:vacuolar-type H+-ATPase subunit H
MDSKDTLAKLLEVESKSSGMLKNAEREANSILAKARDDAARKAAAAYKEAYQRMNSQLALDKKAIDDDISARIEKYSHYLESLLPDTASFETACLGFLKE